MASFGECITGRHDDCRKKIQRWHHGHTGTGRSKKPAIIYLDEYSICSCKCHQPKTKTIRRRRAK